MLVAQKLESVAKLPELLVFDVCGTYENNVRVYDIWIFSVFCRTMILSCIFFPRPEVTMVDNLNTFACILCSLNETCCKTGGLSWAMAWDGRLLSSIGQRSGPGGLFTCWQYGGQSSSGNLDPSRMLACDFLGNSRWVRYNLGLKEGSGEHSRRNGNDEWQWWETMGANSTTNVHAHV